MSLEWNAALANAVAGLAALPSNWESQIRGVAAEFANGCPNLGDMRDAYLADRNKIQQRTEDAQAVAF